jgi:hypothetical protein
MIADPPRTPTQPTTEAREHVKPGDFSAAAASFDQLQAQVRHFLALEMDRIKLVARRAMMFAAIGILALVAATAMVIAAFVFVLQGIAEGVAVLLGSVWAADLLVGTAIFVALTAGIYFGVRRVTKISYDRTRAKHERWHQQQHLRRTSRS